MTNALIPVPFHGQTIDCVRKPDGQVLVSIRRLCENLGLSYPTQWRKLQGQDWACVVMMTTHDESGRSQEMAMLPLDSVPMWLATIHATKVRAELRPALIRYQKECRDVLAKHFLGNKDLQGSSDQIDRFTDAVLARLDRHFAPTAVVEVLRQDMDAKFKALESKMAAINLEDFINEGQRAEIKSLLQQAAKDSGEDSKLAFGKIHGGLRKAFHVSTFNYLPPNKFEDAVEYLRAMLKPPVVSKPQDPNELVDLGQAARELGKAPGQVRAFANSINIKIRTETSAKGYPQQFLLRSEVETLRSAIYREPVH